MSLMNVDPTPLRRSARVQAALKAAENSERMNKAREELLTKQDMDLNETKTMTSAEFLDLKTTVYQEAEYTCTMYVSIAIAFKDIEATVNQLPTIDPKLKDTLNHYHTEFKQLREDWVNVNDIIKKYADFFAVSPTTTVTIYKSKTDINRLVRLHKGLRANLYRHMARVRKLRRLFGISDNSVLGFETLVNDLKIEDDLRNEVEDATTDLDTLLSQLLNMGLKGGKANNRKPAKKPVQKIVNKQNKSKPNNTKPFKKTA